MEENIIYEVKSYFNSQGKIVKVFEPIDGLSNKKFVGSVAIQTQDGVLPIEFDFPEDFISINECFEKFEEALKIFVQKKKDEHRIITSKNNGGNLIIP